MRKGRKWGREGKGKWRENGREIVSMRKDRRKEREGLGEVWKSGERARKGRRKWREKDSGRMELKWKRSYA